MPPNYYKSDAQLDQATMNKPIGSGPYKFVEFVPNDHVTLVLNPDYVGTEKAHPPDPDLPPRA